MILATDEIVSVIQDKIRDYEKQLEVDEIGYVVENIKQSVDEIRNIMKY